MKKNIGTSIILLVLFLSITIGVVEGAINLISNPGFESGTTSWTFYASGGGTFTTPSPGYEGNKSAQLALSNGGTNIQLYQAGVALEANTRYRLSFAAYSNTGHDMTLRLLKHVSPYTPYMPEFTVNLGTSWQTFSNEFTSSGFSGTVNDGRLMFWLPSFAAKGDNYYIDDVRLEKLPQGPIQINSCTKISSPGEYMLTQNIINSGVTGCINITSSDVIFDGAGYTIDGNGLTNYGLDVRNANRITVKNLVIQDWNMRAVNIVNSNNNNFSNITVKSGKNDGFYLQNSNNNILRNITVLNTGNVGFTFDSSQGNDLNGATLQNNAWEDFDIYITGGISSCNNAVKNVILTNNYKLYYYNETVHLNGISAGAIYLCNADNSVITNVEVISVNEQNSISNYYVENVTYANITTSGLREAIFFKYSTNNTITNILMKDGWSGISYSTDTTNTNFKNATIYNMTGRAIRMYASASKNTISDSKIYNNSVGIYLNTAGKYGPNKIYNSVINNLQNIEWGIPDFFGDGSVYPNSWNTTKQPGTNIIGGPYLGGNFWGYPNGTGFSQTCVDGNSDALCDSAYVLKSNNIDYLPLAYNSASGPVHNINKGTNYATIQAAINDASPGDEIHVDSGTYYENVNVNKQLTLRGIGMPVVDAGGSGSVFTLNADASVVDGFVVTNSRGWPVAGVNIISNYNTINGNTLMNNDWGIYITQSSNNSISNNIINNNGRNIWAIGSNNNTISGNIISDSWYPILFGNSKNNIIKGNTIQKSWGSSMPWTHSCIEFEGSSSNSILNNEISLCSNGISLGWTSDNNEIINNTIKNNVFSGIFLNYYPTNNKIYLNNFENSVNFRYDPGASLNFWNITKTRGINIVGGPYLGGNFWGYPNGTGFSQTCTDIDGDGICDSAYTLDGNNTDYLPLAYNPVAGLVHNINNGTNYTTIQAAINDASNGDEIHVDRGRYYENLNLNKKLTLRGIGMPVVDAGGSGSAITLSADMIILEGFTATNASEGISVSSNNNTLIDNSALYNRKGIFIYDSSNNTLIGNSANSNLLIGICLYGSNHMLIGNNVLNNGEIGFNLFSGGNNKIYNNIFNNSYNVELSTVPEPVIGIWNITKTLGTNIVGYPYLGGNLWLNPNGTGFSQTCTDADVDGLCDSAYVLDSNNTDYLPLAYNPTGPVHNINKGTNYATIQAAINDASPGNEIHVDRGTYFENVNISKKLILRGIGMPVVDAAGSGSAITLVADGVLLEGFTVTGGGSYYEAGIKVTSDNNTLIGNNASNNGNGIFLDSSNNNMLIGNNANSNFGYNAESGPRFGGISLYVSSNNMLIGNNVSNNYQYGISQYSSNNNTIYNNIFNNTDNYYVRYSYNVMWNITRQSGTNIVGYPYLGGNFWGNPNGTGFSQTCTDADVDGLCDSTYTIDSNNIDYLPLAYNPAVGPIHNINKGTNYTNIQVAINDASPGDEIHVDRGNYYENVNVNKQLTLRGIGMPVVDAGRSGSAITLAADGIRLEGFNATNASSGIFVTSSNNTLINNNASNNYNSGINLDYSSNNNTLMGNNASYNSGGMVGVGIMLYSNNNTLIGNSANYNYGPYKGYGILLEGNNNTLIGNNINYNHFDGLSLGGSNHMLIGNNVSNNIHGITLWSSGNNVLKTNIMEGNEYNFGLEGGSFDDQIDTTNLVDGKSVYYINGARDIVYDSYTNAGTFYCINCVNVTLKNLELKRNTYGIVFVNTTNSSIQNVTASNNAYGISLSGSNNTLIGNNANSNSGPRHTYEWFGFKGYGIGLWDSSNNTLIGNNANSNSGQNGYGISMWSSSNNTLIGNNANSNMAPGESSGINLESSNNNTLIGNNASNNGYLYDNIYYGIGIRMYESSNNIIFNNIFNNTNNAVIDGSINTWNITRQSGNNIVGGLFLGGNYWSNICEDGNSDGICDSAYVLDGNNTDYLPLALPLLPSITVGSPNGGENWTRGSTQVIRWNYTGSPGTNVKIELLKNGLFNNVLTSSAPIGSSGSGSYPWQINLTQTPGADYKVRINSTTNSTYTDTSNNNFSISPVSDTRPTVIGSTPTGTNVPVKTPITVIFNESMNQTSAQSAFSMSPNTTGSFSWIGNNMTYIPGLNLTYNTTYSVKIGTGAKDLAGNNMSSPYEWQFTTISAATLEERVASLEMRVAALEAALLKLTNP